MIERLQVLTIDHPEISHARQVRMACENGARWIQLRVKDRTYEEWLEIAREAKAAITGFDARLIVNDSVQIAIQIDADGVHLGKDDMPIRSARMLLGDNKIIGGTANSLDEAVKAIESGADYIGLGPYNFTSTKKKLSQILGITGYRNVLKGLRDLGHDVPVIAIGGIQPRDVRPLLVAGLYGVAVASAIFESSNPPHALYEFRQAVHAGRETTDTADAHYS